MMMNDTMIKISALRSQPSVCKISDKGNSLGCG